MKDRERAIIARRYSLTYELYSRLMKKNKKTKLEIKKRQNKYGIIKILKRRKKQHWICLFFILCSSSLSCLHLFQIMLSFIKCPIIFHYLCLFCISFPFCALLHECHSVVHKYSCVQPYEDTHTRAHQKYNQLL